jgi:cyclophilin family peptidyl-prolyl cis-trans isomerase
MNRGAKHRKTIKDSPMNFSKSLTLALIALLLAAPAALAENPRVELDTTKGKIVLELDAEKAPLTVENFLAYVDAGFYDGTIFHRVIPRFMVQGGGFTEAMQKKETRAPIQNEAKNGLDNDRGTIAMARTGDPHSATAQFFINSVNNPQLNQQGAQWGYAVFGKVVEGLDVVDEISAVSTTRRGVMANVPEEAVVIRSAKRVEAAAEEAMDEAPAEQ